MQKSWSAALCLTVLVLGCQTQRANIPGGATATAPTPRLGAVLKERTRPDTSALPAALAPMFEEGRAQIYRFQSETDVHDEEGSVAEMKGSLRCRVQEVRNVGAALVSRVLCRFEGNLDDEEGGDVLSDLTFVATAQGLWVIEDDLDLTTVKEIEEVVRGTPILPFPVTVGERSWEDEDDDFPSTCTASVRSEGGVWCAQEGCEGQGGPNTWERVYCFAPERGMVERSGVFDMGFTSVSWEMDKVMSVLEPVEGYSEARVKLASGQALLVRVGLFEQEEFWAGIVEESGQVVASTEDMLAFYGLTSDDWALLTCEESDVKAEEVNVGGQAFIVITQTCGWGADARGFLDLMRVYRAPTSKAANFGELEFVWAGEGALIENMHDMCVSGHKATLVSQEGALLLTFKAFATFQPDPEFGAVEPEDCVQPEDKPAITLRPTPK